MGAPMAGGTSVNTTTEPESVEAGGVSPVKQWKKYATYDVPVDPNQGDRATVLKMFSFKRPHMQSFHLAWISFFFAFVTWFSFAPLMPKIKKDLGLGKDQVYDANLCSVSSTLAARLVAGPLCDTFGARQMTAFILGGPALVAFFAGFANSATSLCIVRFLIGIMGAVFVATQAWCSQLFAKEIVGSANAIAGGWGNLGGGATDLLMVGVWELFQLFGLSSTMAWRVSFVVPATCSLIIAVITYFYADDCPKGQFKDLIKQGSIERKSSVKSMKAGVSNINTWILGIQYGLCFGMELTIFNVLPSYIHEDFGLKTSKAALVASLFGLINIFSRPLGGIASDFMFRKFGAGTDGMRGRIITQWGLMLMEGITMYIFAKQHSLGPAIIWLLIFSFFVQACNGSVFGIVPYVKPDATGSVSGVVGAGGNLGAIMFGLVFRLGPVDKTDCFIILSYIVMVGSFSCALINVKGHRSLLCKAKGEPESLAVV